MEPQHGMTNSMDVGASRPQPIGSKHTNNHANFMAQTKGRGISGPAHNIPLPTHTDPKTMLYEVFEIIQSSSNAATHKF